MIFASDTWAGASDKVMAGLAEAAKRGGPAYGGDPLSRAVEHKFSEIFERDVTVFFVGTGTAANALALSTVARPGGMILCHREAHISVDEAGACELYGGRLLGLSGHAGKIAADDVAQALSRFDPGHVHAGQAVAISVTQLTELGTAYSTVEIESIAEVARRNALPVHLDGARFAGAVAALAKSPAELTWRIGVDLMSFGGTKNGCAAAEAVIFFDRARSQDFVYARQRAGHGFSKAWFIAAQFAAYLDDDHWLQNARHANAMGARLADAIRRSGAMRIALEPAANEIFAIMPKSLDKRLKAAGVVYGPWSAESLAPEARPQAEEVLMRLVTSFMTTADEIDRFAKVLASA
jgi:threonine aldolase